MHYVMEFRVAGIRNESLKFSISFSALFPRGGILWKHFNTSIKGKAKLMKLSFSSHFIEKMRR